MHHAAMRLQYGKPAEEEVDERFRPHGFVPPALNENNPGLGKPRRPSRLILRVPRFVQPSRTRLDRLQAAYAEEIGHRRLMLLSPVACGSGAALWFTASLQPSLAWLFAAGGLSILLFLYLRHRRQAAAMLAGALALAFAGAILAAFETGHMATVLIDKPVTVTAAGTVLERERAGDGSWRYEIRLSATSDPSLRRMPDRVAVFVRAGEPLSIGDRIEGRMRLSPPSGPALPGLTDFAFQSYFNGLGGTGFLYGPPRHLAQDETGGQPGLLSRFHGWRATTGDHIRGVIGGDEGAFAAALVTNEQRAMSDETLEALRLSGLAHIIAISGMNMALAAGLSFVGLRSLLSLSVGLAQRLPVKKIAAFGALLAVTAYYTISGFAVSAERAYVMMAVMLAAVFFDRPAISMRNIALSAWIILLTRPDALMGASFQMSYAGTLGLVAGYEAWARRRRDLTAEGLPLPRLARAFAKAAGATVATSAIGGTATALFSLAHFQRLAGFGLAANVLATPLLSLVVMPMLMLAMLLMPLGLDEWPLLATGWGLKGVIAIGHWVATWGGEWLPGDMPGWFFVSATFGLLLLALLRTVLRLAGLAVLILSGLLLIALPARPAPDLVVSEDGTLAAFVEEGLLAPSQPKPPGFLFGQWQRALRASAVRKPQRLREPADVRHDARDDRYRPLTDEEEIAERLFIDATAATLPVRQFACKTGAWCMGRYDRGGIVMVLLNRIYTGIACDTASMVVADPPRSFQDCRSGALLISREALRRTGALALRFTGNPESPAITPSFDVLSRPWQAFRSHDWRSGEQRPEIPPRLRALIGARNAGTG